MLKGDQRLVLRLLHRGGDVHLILYVIIISCVASLDKGPAFDTLGLTRVLSILEYLLLLLLRAIEILILLDVLLDSIAGRRHVQSSTTNLVPVNILEERVAFDLACASSPSAQPLAWVAIEQVYDEVLGLLRHADWQLEHTTLYVVE